MYYFRHESSGERYWESSSYFTESGKQCIRYNCLQLVFVYQNWEPKWKYIFFTGFNDNSILAYLLNKETADSNMLNTTEDISGGKIY